MRRRDFLGSLAALQARDGVSADGPRLAVTMDDVRWQVLPDPMAANAQILTALSEHGVKAALFVIAQNAEQAIGERILRSWIDAGHHVANHTYSHRVYSGLTFEAFSEDVLRAERVLAASLGTPKLFRFPALKEGDSAAKRDLMRSFLKHHGYRNGHVTVDASDWYYDSRLRARLKSDPSFEVKRYREPYIAHLWDRARYYDSLSKKVLGRSVAHTLLIHYNLLNSLFLGDVLDHFRRNGWRLIDAMEAYRDPVFQSAPKTVPAGESLLWALAKESGKFEGQLRYPGEDGDYEKPLLDRLGL